MTSHAQIDANRRNAAHSTGPTSADGKARVGFNALRHGIYARDVVLPGEDRQAYQTMLDELRADLCPEGPVENGLVARIADLWWRLGRTAAIEAGYLNADWDGDNRQRIGDQLVDLYRKAIDGTHTLELLGRYEGRLERAFARTIGVLEQAQAARRRRQKIPAIDSIE